MGVLTVDYAPVDDLGYYAHNPRMGNVDVIAESLAMHGQYRPIVVNARTNEVLAGNHTLKAARQLGWTEVAVTRIDVDDDQAARIVLVDNRSNDLADYDDAVLLQLLQSLEDDLDGTGYTDEDLERLLADAEEPPTPLGDPDEVSDVPERPRSSPGDVWILGPHRVVCGDATEPGTWDALLGGEQADCVWTDPPYGVEYVGKTADALTIDGDGPDVVGLRALLIDAFSVALTSCRPGAAWYVAAPAGPQTLAFAQTLTDLGVWRQTLIWVKDQFVLGHSDYHYRHELIYTGYAPGAAGRRGRGGAGWHGPDNEDSVWEVPRPQRSSEHPTMKPVELIVRALTNSTVDGAVVADPFAGSGSTLIACHQMRRVARLVEMDPRYVDVICQRYQTTFGGKPVLDRTGEPHDFLG